MRRAKVLRGVAFRVSSFGFRVSLGFRVSGCGHKPCISLKQEEEKDAVCFLTEKRGACNLNVGSQPSTSTNPKP